MNTVFYLQNIYWREPLWLLLVILPFIFILLKKLVINNNLLLYAEKKLQPWIVFPASYAFTKHIFSKNTAYLLAWLLFSIALAGPRTPLSQIDKEQQSGANIMLVVDLSRSMNAMDILPNRLRRAKIEIYELLEKARQHRIGITVFSARPHLFVPLTSDHAVLKTYLKTLDKLQFPTKGSDPVTALLFAQQELAKVQGKSVIILLSDGDYPLETNNQLGQLKLNNIPLYILGIGTAEGEAIQLDDGTWLKHEQQHVISRMNGDNLHQLATQLNGKYSPVHDDDTDWDELYDQGIVHHSTFTRTDNKQRIIWDELFPYFLFPSILLFWFSLSSYRFKDFKNITLFALTSTLIFFFPEENSAAFEIGETSEQSAYRAYIKGDYSKAESLYKNKPGYSSHFGQGNSLYKMGNFPESIQQFALAVLSAQTDKQRADALYNLANSYFRTGDFSSAIDVYNDVLRYQAENKASLYNMNISLVLRKNIEQRLKEEQRILNISRQGRGAQSKEIADATDISESTSVSVGDNENLLKENIPLPQLPDLNEDTVKKLLLSGLKNIKLAEQGDVPNQHFEYKNNDNLNIIKAQQQLNIINDSQHLLWKRLFEIEEGFPAPVETARELPGVNPW